VEEVKRFIDIMTVYKLNRFHFHLTDDQGWRVEIKSYPKLTEIGAWRSGTCIQKDFDSNDGIRHGGFYTQEELRDIVAYAAERNITIIPEIDLPGHMLAALASYPELGCTGGPYEVRTCWGISRDILCAGNDDVYKFLEAVLAEVMEIFPSEYIHIGGDECFGGRRDKGKPIPWDSCPKCAARMKELGIKPGPEARHLLQNYVTARVQDFLLEHGRKVIGWDEILEGDLKPGATIMSWRGIDGGVKAAAKGFDVIMSPNKYMYLDYYQSQEIDKEPFAIGGHLPVEKVYGYEPFEGMEDGSEDHILGVQCNLWTEYVATPEHLEYMLLPRMCAESEVAWCDSTRKDFTRFNESLDHAFRMFDVMGYNYSLDIRCLIGLDRIPARTSEQLEDYLTNGRK
jgi:hexosaminidase